MMLKVVPRVNYGYYEHLIADAIQDRTPKLYLTIKKARKITKETKIRQRKARNDRKRQLKDDN